MIRVWQVNEQEGTVSLYEWRAEFDLDSMSYDVAGSLIAGSERWSNQDVFSRFHLGDLYDDKMVSYLTRKKGLWNAGAFRDNYVAFPWPVVVEDAWLEEFMAGQLRALGSVGTVRLFPNQMSSVAGSKVTVVIQGYSEQVVHANIGFARGMVYDVVDMGDLFLGIASGVARERLKGRWAYAIGLAGGKTGYSSLHTAAMFMVEDPVTRKTYSAFTPSYYTMASGIAKGLLDGAGASYEGMLGAQSGNSLNVMVMRIFASIVTLLAMKDLRLV